MPVERLSPRELKDAFETSGFLVLEETDHNWVMAKDAHDPPFIIPKKGKLVSREILDAAMDHAPASSLHKTIYEKLHSRS